ncbi:hypothetical protein DEO72_LG10g1373 [Vigna unguiculata]|uniref:Uncharacterized protein n=1 Tax=Vigna unguiculata TaxID=3917 RepID=A0A4D6NE45_VIGUN|nr:hypothetical protein DEO72_LG10g1373 [Vigna unguiculata]
MVDGGCGGSIKNGGVGWFFLSSTAALVVGFSLTTVAPRDIVGCSGSSCIRLLGFDDNESSSNSWCFFGHFSISRILVNFDSTSDI